MGRKEKATWSCGDPDELKSGVGDPAPRDRTIPPFRILGPDHLFPTRLALLSRKSVSPPHFSDPNITPSQYSLVSSWSPSGSTFTPASDPTNPLTTEAGPRCLYSRIFRHVLVSVTIGSQHSIHFPHSHRGLTPALP